MKNHRTTMKILIATVGCFLISYASSVLGDLNSEKPYPQSLVKNYSNHDTEKGTVTINKDLAAAGISEIIIQTTNTDVILKTSMTNQMSLALDGQYAVDPKDPDSPLMTDTKDGVLTVKVNESSGDEHHLFNFNFDSDGEGKLVISIPATIKKLVVKTVSGDFKADAAKLDSLTLASVSGDAVLENLEVKALTFKTVSGDLRAEGKVEDVSAAGVSGDTKLKLANKSPTIDIHTTSGDSFLAFKDVPDLDVKFSSVSGDFVVSHHFSKTDTDGSKVSMVLGSGKGRLSANTVSGDVKLEKY